MFQSSVHIHSGFVPPRRALEEVVGVVSAACPAPEVATQPTRRFGLRRGQTAVLAPAEPVLTIKSMDGMIIPIATFGNVTPPDARRVTDALTSAAADWPSPSLYFGGATVADHRGRRTIWVRVGGDVADLTTIARSVPQCVERLGFFVDRRRFHPLLPIVTVSDRATEAEVDTVVGALEALHGRTWTMDAFTLFTTVFVGTHSESEPLDRIPLGSPSGD